MAGDMLLVNAVSCQSVSTDHTVNNEHEYRFLQNKPAKLLQRLLVTR